jgi:hypothetical protein
MLLVLIAVLTVAGCLSQGQFLDNKRRWQSKRPVGDPVQVTYPEAVAVSVDKPGQPAAWPHEVVRQSL